MLHFAYHGRSIRMFERDDGRIAHGVELLDFICTRVARTAFLGSFHDGIQIGKET